LKRWLRACATNPRTVASANEVCICNVDSRLLYRHLHAKGLRVQLDEDVAFAHAVIVVHQNSHHLAGNARRKQM
jgi:hypothetical protein